MGHISQAWTNLALPSADCVRDCAMVSTASLLLWHFQILTTGSIHCSRDAGGGVLLAAS